MDNRETRSIAFQVRAETDSRTITGTAAVFDTPTMIGGFFEERIAVGAFTESVKRDDIVATFNHNFDNVLARTDSNTLKVTTDSKGLNYSFEAPNTTAGNDILENVRNGNVKGGSMMFRIDEETWAFAEKAGDIDKRTIEKGSLVELGPVTMPAYKQTSISATRAVEQHEEEAKKALEAAKEQENITKTLQLKRKRTQTK